MTNQDDNNQEIEKVEDVEVETTKKTSDSDDKKQNDDEYEKVCFICRRPESVAGKMIELPNHICVCNDCMQKSFDAMSNGPIDYSQLMNIPGVQVFNMYGAEYSKTAEDQEEKRRRRIQAVSRYPESSGSAQDQSKTGRVCGRTGICKESDVGCGI